MAGWIVGREVAPPQQSGGIRAVVARMATPASPPTVIAPTGRRVPVHMLDEETKKFTDMMEMEALRRTT